MPKLGAMDTSKECLLDECLRADENDLGRSEGCA